MKNKVIRPNSLRIPVSAEILQAKREWHDVFKVLKESDL